MNPQEYQAIQVIIERQGQLEEKMDNMTTGMVDREARIRILEGEKSKGNERLFKFLIPVLITSLTISLGTLGLTITVLFELLSHITGH